MISCHQQTADSSFTTCQQKHRIQCCCAFCSLMKESQLTDTGRRGLSAEALYTMLLWILQSLKAISAISAKRHACWCLMPLCCSDACNCNFCDMLTSLQMMYMALYFARQMPWRSRPCVAPKVDAMILQSIHVQHLFAELWGLVGCCLEVTFICLTWRHSKC